MLPFPLAHRVTALLSPSLPPPPPLSESPTLLGRMDLRIRGESEQLCFALYLLLLLLAGPCFALPEYSHKPSSSATAQINYPNSVLVALLDSHYSELAELVEKALLLQTLEEAVGRHNITIFAPRNDALERDLDPDFKRYLLEPGNLKSLQKLLLFHVIPTRVGSDEWPSQTTSTRHQTLSDDHLHLSRLESGEKAVDLARVIHPDSVTRPDGVIHAIERLLIPRSVEDDFNRRRSLRSIIALKPEGAPEVDPRTNRLKIPASPTKPGSSPVDAVAPGASLAPAPAPRRSRRHDRRKDRKSAKDFIPTSAPS